MNSLLDVRDLSFFYRSEQILEKISFSLSRGQSLGVIGPNGGGKSTLLKILAGLLPFKYGEICIEDRSYKKRVSAEDIDYIPQEINFEYSLPLTINDYLSFYCDLRKSKQNSLQSALEVGGLTKKKNCKISELSGGERQRLLLAKTFLMASKILILDEPIRGLDSKGQDQLIEILNLFLSERKMGIILVDHNISQVIDRCDQIICLNKIQHYHERKELISETSLQSLYRCEFEHLLLHKNFPGHPHKDRMDR